MNVTQRVDGSGKNNGEASARMHAQGQELPEALMPRSPLAEFAGLRLASSDGGRATVVLPVSEAVLSESGGIDNAAITLLIEAAGAAAVASDAAEGEPPDETVGETVELFVTFARSAPEHPLTAEARVVRRERHVRMCEVAVRDWNGDFVARGSLTQRA